MRLALDVPDDHAVDPRALVAALAAAVEAAGGEIAARACDGRRDGGSRRRRRRRRRSRRGTSSSPPARGAASSAACPVRPVKGQILRLRDPPAPGCVDAHHPHAASGYLVPRGDGRYVLGATMEERGFDTTPTAGAVYELLRDAAELVPGVLELELEEVARRPAPRHARQRCR